MTFRLTDVLAIGLIILAFDPNDAHSDPESETSIQVAGNDACMSAKSLQDHLQGILEAQGALNTTNLTVRVTIRKVNPALFLIKVNVSRNKEVGLSRTYRLSSTDCQSLDELLQATLERFFTEFPKWRVPKPAPEEPVKEPELVKEPEPPQKKVDIDLSVKLNLSGDFTPLGGSAALGLGLRLGRTHRLLISLWARGSLPAKLGDSQYLQTALLGATGWQYAKWAWQPRIEVRVGTLNTVGLNFDTNESVWKFWTEGVVGIDRSWQRWTLGLEVALSPMRYQVANAEQTVVSNVPWMRIGLTLQWYFWAKQNERQG